MIVEWKNGICLICNEWNEVPHMDQVRNAYSDVNGSEKVLCFTVQVEVIKLKMVF